jgi:hypothetical protein
MTSDSIDEAFVKRAACAVGLELVPSHVSGVVRYFTMIAVMAESVAAFRLEAEAEPAAVFIPCSAPTRD